jgi:hypothetical protein
MSMAATFETWSQVDEDEHEDQSIHRLAFAKFYEYIWTCTRDHLQQLMVKVPRASPLYFVILKGLLQISSDLSLFALKCCQLTNSENSYNPILIACESFFNCLLELNTPFNNRYLTFESNLSTKESLVSEWIRNFVTDVKADNLYDDKIYDSLRNTGKIEHKSHLLAILPYAHKMLATYDGIQTSAALKMKSVAVEIIDAIDIRALTEVLLKLSEEISTLKTENAALRSEVSDNIT